MTLNALLKIFLIGNLVYALSMALFTQIVAGNAIVNQTARASQNVLDKYLQGINKATSEMETHIFQYLSSSQDVRLLQRDTDYFEQFSAEREITMFFFQFLSLHSLASGVTLIGNETTGPEDSVTASTQVVNYADISELNYQMEQIIRNDAYSKRDWFVITLDNGRNYIIRIIPSKHLHCCIWITMESIERSFIEFNFNEVSYFSFTDGNGHVLNEDPVYEQLDLRRFRYDQYVQINGKTDFGDFRVSLLLLEDTITQELQSIRFLVTVLIFVGLIFIPIAFILAKRFIYTPFSHIIQAMEEAAGGDLNTHIQAGGNLVEFRKVNTIFNTMIDEIKKIKIEAYENRIQEQKIKKHFLQSQIKSHFFLNCINNIYILAQDQDYPSIQRLSMCLAKYFRYIAANADHLVPLKNEIAHVENYIEIEKFRYPGRIKYFLEINDYEQESEPRIPTLMLHTFVENAIKYGQVNQKELHVTLTVHVDADSCELRIHDNGNGFPETTLGQLTERNEIHLSSLEGIGIQNIKNRLALIYHGKARIKFTNQDGADIRIWLPS